MSKQDHHQQQQPLLSEQLNSIVEESLEGDDVVGDGSVDIRGRPSKPSTSGRWTAVYFIMGTYLLIHPYRLLLNPTFLFRNLVLVILLGLLVL
jgi:hypothetical protein